MASKKKTTKVCVGGGKRKKCLAPMTKREAAEVVKLARAILAGKFKYNKNVRLVRVI